MILSKQYIILLCIETHFHYFGVWAEQQKSFQNFRIFPLAINLIIIQWVGSCHSLDKIERMKHRFDNEALMRIQGISRRIDMYFDKRHAPQVELKTFKSNMWLPMSTFVMKWKCLVYWTGNWLRVFDLRWNWRGYYWCCRDYECICKILLGHLLLSCKTFQNFRIFPLAINLMIIQWVRSASVKKNKKNEQTKTNLT